MKSLLLRSEFAVAAIKDTVATQVAVFAPETRIVVAQTLFDIEKLLSLALGEVVHTSELPGENQDAAISVDDLRVEISVLEVRAKRRGAMIGKNDRVAIFDIRNDCLGKLLRAGRLVAGHRHFAEKNFDLG